MNTYTNTKIFISTHTLSMSFDKYQSAIGDGKEKRILT